MAPIRRLVAGALVVALGLAGCTEEDEQIEMTRVPAPPGGVVDTVAVTDATGESPELIAPADDTLYRREIASNDWTPHRVSWPNGFEQTAASPVSGLFWARKSFNFPTDHRLTTHRGRTWMLTRAAPSGDSALLVSDDGGRQWSAVDLPSPFRGSDGRASTRSNDNPKKLARIDARAPIRVVSRGEAGLYLLGANRVWKATFTDDAPPEVSTWERVQISGTDVLGSAAPTTFPKVVRNFLPATDNRPFDLLTVFGDRLYIYRRHTDSNRWVLVSTLPTIDIDLRATGDGQTVYLFAPEALYRSNRQGEQWEKLTLTSPLESAPSNSGFAFLPPTNEHDSEPPFPGLVVGTDRGAIYRSLDGGDTWKRVREPDPDGRAITGIVAHDASSHLWASTAGRGVLVSEDRGKTWTPANRGMRAATPAAITHGPNDEFLAGTLSGLFRLTGAPEDGHWDRIHDRATTAIEVDADKSNVVAGTLGGALVTEGTGGGLNVSEAGTYEGQNAPLFEASSSPPWLQRPSAILTIDARPNSSQLFAWSRGEGMLESTDAGDSWRRNPLNRALRSALARSVITNFVVDHDGRMYLSSQPFELESPAQLWRSFNNGETWHAVYTFPGTRSHYPLLLRRPPNADAETLFMAHGSQLARSTDAGDTWRDLPGPWSSGTIRAYSADRDKHTLLYNSRHSSHVAFVRRTDQQTPSTETYSLTWPDTNDQPRPDIRNVVSIEQFVYAITDDAVYAGSIPEGDAQLPHAPTIMATLVVILLVTGLSFFYLRNANVDPRDGSSST